MFAEINNPQFIGRQVPRSLVLDRAGGYDFARSFLGFRATAHAYRATP